SAAQRNTVDAHGAIDAYALTKYDYVRQVDVHSHWIGLGMVLIVLGVVLEHVAFSSQVRMWIAAALVAGSFVFPLGVILQTVTHGAAWASGLAILGSATVTIALGALVWGFARSSL